MRVLGILILVLLQAGCNSSSPHQVDESCEPNNKIYFDTNNHYSLKFPLSWKINRIDDFVDLCASSPSQFSDPDLFNGDEIFTLRSFKVSDTMDTDKEFEQKKLGLTGYKSFHGVVIKDDYCDTEHGPARYMRIRFDNGCGSIAVKTYAILVTKGRGFEFKATTNSVDHNCFHSQFLTALSSFRVY